MNEVPKMLRSMRWVFGHQQGEERNQEERTCRQYFIDDFKGFMAKLGELERAYQVSKRHEKPDKAETADAGDAAVDQGTEQVAELLAEEWQLVQQFRAAQESAGQPPVPSVVAGSGDAEPA